MGYIHIEIDSAQTPKKQGAVCGDAFTWFRRPEATVILLADGIGSGIKANVYAGMTLSRLQALLENGVSLRNAFASLVKTMHAARGTDLPYAVFTVVQILKNGETTILAYEMPEGIFLGKHAATPCKRRDFTFGNDIISETILFLEPGEGIVLFTDGISQAGMGLTTRTGWSSKEICSFLNGKLNLDLNSPAKAVHDKARSLWQGFRGDDCTVISAICRVGKIVNIMTGPPADRGKDAAVTSNFFSQNGTKIICGATTAKVVAHHLGRQLQINRNDHSLIAPPGYSLEGIDLVSEGAVTLNQAYNILDVDPVNFEPDSSVSRLCELLIQADRVNFFVGSAENEAHADISFKQRGIIPRGKIVRLLAERLRRLGKLVEVSSC